jgi:hypothetical protein
VPARGTGTPGTPAIVEVALEVVDFTEAPNMVRAEAKSRESACPGGCRVCFLARKYGLTPREVGLIAVTSSGKSGRAPSVRHSTLGCRRSVSTAEGFMARLALTCASQVVYGRSVRGWGRPRFNLYPVFRLLDPLEEVLCYEIQTAPDESDILDRSG